MAASVLFSVWVLFKAIRSKASFFAVVYIAQPKRSERKGSVIYELPEIIIPHTLPAMQATAAAREGEMSRMQYAVNDEITSTGMFSNPHRAPQRTAERQDSTSPSLRQKFMVSIKAAASPKSTPRSGSDDSERHKTADIANLATLERSAG